MQTWWTAPGTICVQYRSLYRYRPRDCHAAWFGGMSGVRVGISQLPSFRRSLDEACSISIWADYRVSVSPASHELTRDPLLPVR
jgi:hypothetical protein